MPKQSIVGAVFVGLVLACGCTTTIALPGSNETSSTGGIGGETSSIGGSGGTAGSGGFAGSGGTGGTTVTSTSAPDCQAWVDYPGIATQTLLFVNQTGQTLYLPTLCDGRVSFNLSVANGPSDYAYVYDTSCLQTCEALETQPPYACGGCQPTSIRLLPGEERSFSWDGTALEQILMEPSCFYDSTSGTNGTCPMKRTAVPGSYTATGTAGAECAGSCSCDAQGTCTGTPSGGEAQAMATFSFPSTGSVEVVFGPCAFGCGG